jgi:L-seryl-tRNA(Ser) seleniumtransferase
MDEAPPINERLRSLPAIDELLGRPSLAPLFDKKPRPLVVRALREAVERARQRILKGDAQGFVEADVASALEELSSPRLVPVINATGVVLHTNLGRAPLAESAARRAADLARGYANLEIDLAEGERGSRYAPVVELLKGLTGAEDALVVNNCASAAMLALSALSKGKEAIVSRGELVEIGGGFRVPEVMEQSGATLVEVGTTNRTRIADYEKAITEKTGALVKIHRSNFAVVGFTEDVSVKELAALGKARGIPVFHDLGSGLLEPLHAEGLAPEPTVGQSIAQGADVVAFSGDKLLGGPQAGILVGKAALIEKLARHPLNRAVRIDKLTIAALEATLELYRDGRSDEIPVRRLLTQTSAELESRAKALSDLLTAEGIAHRVVTTDGKVGGGSMPLATLASYGCALTGAPAAQLHAALRQGKPSVLARVNDDELLLDVRCVFEPDLKALAQAVRKASGG